MSDNKKLSVALAVHKQKMAERRRAMWQGGSVLDEASMDPAMKEGAGAGYPDDDGGNDDPEAIKEREKVQRLAEGGDVLDTKDREHIKDKNFALPKERKYPIEDATHARNALARVSQFGTPSEKAEVREKVHAKYPNIGSENKMAEGGQVPGMPMSGSEKLKRFSAELRARKSRR